MNLHISAPSVFIDTFYKNLSALGLDRNNKIVLRSASAHANLPFGKLYSRQFDALIGKTEQYEKVFIHQFNPLLYRWVAQHEFRQLNWMVWGADLYGLPSFAQKFYEPLTRQYALRSWNMRDLLYKAKVFATAARFRNSAYGKVDNVLTWMKGEFDFAREQLGLRAEHKFFFYENQTSYLDVSKRAVSRTNVRPTYILGNSATVTNNHLDIIDFLERENINADLVVPVSYGDAAYADFLKRNAGRYTRGSITFIDKFMTSDDYISFLNSCDGLIMNTLRPQGYGNIFMMLSLGRPVFLNEKNLSLMDLKRNHIQYLHINDLAHRDRPQSSSYEAIDTLFSRERLSMIYRELFS